MSLDLVVIGASAGGLEGLLTIVSGLPQSLPAAVLIVMHGNSRSQLPAILSRAAALPVGLAEDGASLTLGRIVVAPPDYHLLVEGRRTKLHRGPRENGFRPAIDPLFRTAARELGGGVMGVILSGALDDGTSGMQQIQEAGGVVVVQDPDEAPIPAMPLSVLGNVGADHVLPAAAIADLIVEQAGRKNLKNRKKGAARMARSKQPEPQDPADTTEVADMNAAFGPPSGQTCPDCGGALWETAEGQLSRYRCHVGHQFSLDALEAQQRDAVEAALWSAVRILEEQADLRLRLAERVQAAGIAPAHERFIEGARDSHRKAQAIRDLLFGGDGLGPEPSVADPPGSGRPNKRAAPRRTAKPPRSRGAR